MKKNKYKYAFWGLIIIIISYWLWLTVHEKKAEKTGFPLDPVKEMEKLLTRYNKGDTAYYEVSVQNGNGSDFLFGCPPFYLPLSDDLYSTLYFSVKVQDVYRKHGKNNLLHSVRVVLKFIPLQQERMGLMDKFPFYAIDFQIVNNKLRIISGAVMSNNSTSLLNDNKSWPYVFSYLSPWYIGSERTEGGEYSFTYLINDICSPKNILLKQRTIMKYNAIYLNKKFFMALQQDIPTYYDKQSQSLKSFLPYANINGQNNDKFITCNKGIPLTLQYTELQWWKEDGVLWERMVRYSNQGHILFKGRRLNKYPPPCKNRPKIRNYMKFREIDMDYMNFKKNKGEILIHSPEWEKQPK